MDEEKPDRTGRRWTESAHLSVASSLVDAYTMVPSKLDMVAAAIALLCTKQHLMRFSADVPMITQFASISDMVVLSGLEVNS